MPPLSALVLAIASSVNPRIGRNRYEDDHQAQASEQRDVEKDDHGEEGVNGELRTPRSVPLETADNPEEDEEVEVDESEVEIDDVDDNNHPRRHTRDDILAEDELGDTTSPEGVHRNPGRFPRVNTVTSFGSSVSQLRFSRPSLPSWLTASKNILFGSSYPKVGLASSSSSQYAPNYRIMPIISGVLMPFAILLEIPGITEHWYIRTDGVNIVETRSNSVLLDVGLALSMMCAVAANAAILTRFLERKVKAMTILAALFLTIHDVINITAVVVFGVEHRFNDGFTYGEAYWLTVCSTIVSTVTNITLLWDLFTVPNFKNSGSGITKQQRSLIIITITFLTYSALGALLTSLLMHLTFLDGLYFTLVTTLTIGFGDIHPDTPVQRVVVCLYASFGIMILGGAIRLISEAVVEGLEMGYMERLQRFKRERKAKRREEREDRRWRGVVEKKLMGLGLEIWVSDTNPGQHGGHRQVGSNGERSRVRSGSESGSSLRRASWYLAGTMGGVGGGELRLNTEALTPGDLEQAALDAGVSLEKYRWKRIVRSAAKVRRDESRSQMSLRSPVSPTGLQSVDEEDGGAISERRGNNGISEGATNILAPIRTESPVPSNSSHAGVSNTLTSSAEGSMLKRWMTWSAEWWKKTYDRLVKKMNGEFEARELAKILEREKKRDLYVRLTVAWSLFFIFWISGALIFAHTETWPVGTGLYFCFITFTSIGYGDFAPLSSIGRAIFVFWAVLGVCAMTILISVISDAFSSKYHNMMHDRSFEKAIRRYRSNSKHRSGKPDTDRFQTSFSYNTSPRTSRARSHSRGINAPSPVATPPNPSISAVASAAGALETRRSGGSNNPAVSRIAPALEANLARLSTSVNSQSSANRSRSTGPPASPSTHHRNMTLNLPVRTLEEAEVKIKERTEILPELVLQHVQKFREHLRYFLVTNGHTAGGLAEAMVVVGEHAQDEQGEVNATGSGVTNGMRVPEEMRVLLDEIAAQEGIGDRLKEEVWQDAHARNTLFVLGIETGIRRLVDAASDALQVLAERDRLIDEVDAKLAIGVGRPSSAHDLPEDIAIRLVGLAPDNALGHQGVFEEEWKQEKRIGEGELGLQEEIEVDMGSNQAGNTTYRSH